MTIAEIIHVFENSRLVSKYFTEDAVTAAYVEALAALHIQQDQRSHRGDRTRCTEWRGEHAAVTVNTVNYIDLLARYEDTGLTPDEITALLAERGPRRPCDACGYRGKHLDAPPCTECPAFPAEE